MDPMVKRLQTYADTSNISAVETSLSERMQKMEDRIKETHHKLRKELKKDLYQISSVETRGPVIRGRCPPARERYHHDLMLEIDETHTSSSSEKRCLYYSQPKFIGFSKSIVTNSGW